MRTHETCSDVRPGVVRRLLATGVTVTVLAGCGTEDGDGRTAATAVEARSVSDVGTVLAEAGSGRTLYLFLPDAQQTPNCADDCLVTWPAALAEAVEPAAGKGLRGDLLDVVQDGQGRSQLTYNGWPLYRFVGDVEAGQANGHALDLDGGLWFAVAPDGTPAGEGAP